LGRSFRTWATALGEIRCFSASEFHQIYRIKLNSINKEVAFSKQPETHNEFTSASWTEAITQTWSDTNFISTILTFAVRKVKFLTRKAVGRKHNQCLGFIDAFSASSGRNSPQEVTNSVRSLLKQKGFSD